MPKQWNYIAHGLLVCLMAACSREIVVPQPAQSATGPVVLCALESDSFHTISYSRVVGISEVFQPQTNASIFLSVGKRIQM